MKELTAQNLNLMKLRGEKLEECLEKAGKLDVYSSDMHQIADRPVIHSTV